VCCSVLQCVVVSGLILCLFGSVLQCIAVCCSVLQCVAVCGRVLQCVAVCCSELAPLLSVIYRRKCGGVAVWCNVLQCVTVCCSVLQCVAVVL